MKQLPVTPSCVHQWAMTAWMQPHQSEKGPVCLTDSKGCLLDPITDTCPHWRTTLSPYASFYPDIPTKRSVPFSPAAHKIWASTDCLSLNSRPVAQFRKGSRSSISCLLVPNGSDNVSTFSASFHPRIQNLHRLPLGQLLLLMATAKRAKAGRAKLRPSRAAVLALPDNGFFQAQASGISPEVSASSSFFFFFFSSSFLRVPDSNHQGHCCRFLACILSSLLPAHAHQRPGGPVVPTPVAHVWLGLPHDKGQVYAYYHLFLCI